MLKQMVVVYCDVCGEYVGLEADGVLFDCEHTDTDIICPECSEARMPKLVVDEMVESFLKEEGDEDE